MDPIEKIIRENCWRFDKGYPDSQEDINYLKTLVESELKEQEETKITKKDLISFHKKPPNNFEIEPDRFNYFNSNTWDVPVEPGKLILFPSYLEHSVPVVKENVTRISLSFNTFIVGNINEGDAISLSL